MNLYELDYTNWKARITRIDAADQQTVVPTGSSPNNH